MKPYPIIILLLVLFSFPGRSQGWKTSEKSIKLRDKSLEKDFVEISGGAITYDIWEIARNGKDVARKSIHGISYIAKTEVSVKQYINFLKANNGVYEGLDLNPSISGSFLFEGTTLKEYLSNAAYRNFPIVGVSLLQARAYCRWFTAKENKRLTSKKNPLEIKCLLPYSSQLQAAQLKAFNDKDSPFPKLTSEYLQQVESASNFKNTQGKNRPHKVKTHKAPTLPLYNITGNVGEWISDPPVEDTLYFQAIRKYDNTQKSTPRRLFYTIPDSIQPTLGIIQGGSYNIDAKFLSPDTYVVLPLNKGYSWVGFRPILYCTEVKKSSQKK
jgi:formylglycine-generating enzyme required for sulfatase activity